jgi:hypothetical protein
MAVLCLVFLICSLRTNIVYVVVFSTQVAVFGLLTGNHFQVAVGNTDLASGLEVVCSPWPITRNRIINNLSGCRCWNACELHGTMVDLLRDYA